MTTRADQTPIKYCYTDYGEKKTRPGGNVYYRWSCSRAHRKVTTFLEGYKGLSQLAAILYSILISWQRLEIDITDYLQDVLTQDTRILENGQLAALTPACKKYASSS